MEISSRYIKLNAAFEIPFDLTIGRDYPIELQGSITACTEKDGQDGTLEREYRFKAILGAIKGEGIPSVKLKDKTSKSFRLRTMITREFDLNYEQAMDGLMSDPVALQEFIEKQL